MASPLPGDDSHLSRIATHWPKLLDRDKCEVARYWRAIYCYIVSAVRRPEEAEELTGVFLERFVSGTYFAALDPAKGRFRDYLKRCLHNMVADHLRAEKAERKHRQPLPDSNDVPAQAASQAEDDFDRVLGEDCLARAWAELFQLQKSTRIPYATVLEYKTNQPQLRSDALAAQLNVQLGTNWNAASVRKTVERAREYFAGFLIDEVMSSLPTKENDRLEDELIALKLLPYVKATLERRKAAG